MGRMGGSGQPASSQHHGMEVAEARRFAAFSAGLVEGRAQQLR